MTEEASSVAQTTPEEVSSDKQTTPEEISSTPQTTPEEPKPKNNRRTLTCCLLLPVGACIATALLAGGYFLAGSLVASSIQSAYQASDCQQVIAKAWPVEKLYPSKLTDTITQSQAEVVECRAYMSASEKQEQEDWDSAYQEYKTYLDTYPDGAMTTQASENAAASLYALGQEQQQAGSYEQADENLQILAREFDETTAYADGVLLLAENYVLWGEELQKEEDYAAALKKYESAIDSDPAPGVNDGPAAHAHQDLPDLHRAWAQALSKQGEYSDAVDHLQSASQSAATADKDAIMGEMTDAYLGWASALSDSEEYLQALDKVDLAKEAGGSAVAPKTSEAREAVLAGLATSTGDDANTVMQEAASAVCTSRGKAVLAYSFFGTNESSKRVYVHFGTEKLAVSSDVRAQSPATMGYVACLTRSSATVQTCPYSGGYSIERKRINWKVEVFDVLTGRLFRQTQIYGSLPDPCAYTEMFTIGTYHQTRTGGEPSAGDLNKWLSTFIK
jgi:tetratricopeptide (TPR) repeat protein